MRCCFCWFEHTQTHLKATLTEPYSAVVSNYLIKKFPNSIGIFGKNAVEHCESSTAYLKCKKTTRREGNKVMKSTSIDANSNYITTKKEIYMFVQCHDKIYEEAQSLPKKAGKKEIERNINGIRQCEGVSV